LANVVVSILIIVTILAVITLAIPVILKIPGLFVLVLILIPNIIIIIDALLAGEEIQVVSTREKLAELARLEQLFDLDVTDLRRIVEAFLQEMNNGLKGLPSSLKMLLTYIGNATGREKGVYLGLDLGGSNFRVLMVILPGNGRKPKIIIKKGVAYNHY